MDALRELEVHAYATVLKAFMARPVDEWDKEEVMTKLRALWHIDNDVHMDVIRQLKNDSELQAIREGRDVRLNRGKTFKLSGSQALPPLAPAPSLPGSGGALMTQPSMQARRGPGRPSGGLEYPGGAVRAASTRQQRPTRPRSSSLSGVSDPRGFLGRRCWRLWPTESPPWVEGVVYEYDPETDSYTILYDPNVDPDSGHAETMEANYTFSNPDEYVLCEKIDFLTMPGSRRQWDKPTMDSPPPPMPITLLTGAPSKKRKSLASMPMPQHAPFDPGFFASQLQLATEEELLEMAALLERREHELTSELALMDAEGVSEADLARRAELERKLHELGDKEYDLMAELAKLEREL